MEKRYDKDGQRVTSCCGSYSTYHDETLCCKSCYNEVDFGEGDGSEFRAETEMLDLVEHDSERAEQEAREAEDLLLLNMDGSPWTMDFGQRSIDD